MRPDREPGWFELVPALSLEMTQPKNSSCRSEGHMFAGRVVRVSGMQTPPPTGALRAPVLSVAENLVFETRDHTNPSSRMGRRMGQVCVFPLPSGPERFDLYRAVPSRPVA